MQFPALSLARKQRAAVRSPSSRPRHSRCGLTLVEVLVTLFIVAVMLSFIGLIHQGHRTTARRVECLEHIRHIGVAMQTYATSNSDQLPTIMDSAGYNWPTQILAEVYQTQLQTAGPTYYGNKQNANSVGMRIFYCPSDENNYYRACGLSYAVNAGAGDWSVGPSGWAETYAATGPNDEFAMTRLHWGDIDWDGGGISRLTDLEIARDTGVFHRAYADGTPSAPGKELDSFRMTLGRVRQNDGLSQTLLLGENTDAMNWGYSTLGSPTHNGVIQTAFTINGSPYSDSDVVFAGTAEAPLAIVSINAAGKSWISAPGGIPGATPTLTANHEGVVNCAFCDGSAKHLSQFIDRRIYVQLMSSGGIRRGQSSTLSSTDY